MRFPNKPRKGRSVQEDVTDIVNYLRASRIVNVVGGRMLCSANGTTLEIKPGKSGKGVISPNAPKPWQASFVTESEVLKVSFRLGTCNNVVPTNWNTKFTAPTGDVVQFVILEVNSTGGKVTSCELSLSATAPANDDVSKDTPPTTHKIVLGAIGENTSQMAVTTNLSISASEVFRETAAASADRAEPFHRWYRWQNSSAAS